MENLETQEITLAKQDAHQVIDEVVDIKITSKPTVAKAKTLLSKITNSQKIIKGIRESIIKPSMESIRNARAFFSPTEDKLKEANTLLKEKMYNYNLKIKAEAVEKKEAIAEKVEGGELDFDKASKKIEKVEEKANTMPTRKMRVIEIVDETKIPKQYWELDMVSLRRDALAGVQIDGVKVVEKEIIVSH